MIRIVGRRSSILKWASSLGTLGDWNMVWLRSHCPLRLALHLQEHLLHFIDHVWILLPAHLLHQVLKLRQHHIWLGVTLIRALSVILNDVRLSLVILLIMIVRTHWVSFKLNLRKLSHWQVVLRKDTDLDVIHISTWLSFKNGWMIKHLWLRVRIFTLISSCAYKLRVIVMTVKSLLLAKLMAVLK